MISCFVEIRIDIRFLLRSQLRPLWAVYGVLNILGSGEGFKVGDCCENGSQQY